MSCYLALDDLIDAELAHVVLLVCFVPTTALLHRRSGFASGFLQPGAPRLPDYADAVLQTLRRWVCVDGCAALANGQRKDSVRFPA